MTKRLYYDNAYLTEFDATVLRCEPQEQGFRVLLDKSAFYPTSGGQPFDTGSLGGVRVTDVEVEEGEVWHTLDVPLAVGESVHGAIDWPRRFDHMQQHAADHMIAGLLYHRYGATTIGLHISGDVSTIDVAMPEGRVRLEKDEICALEEEVNRRVQADLPIRCWFPEEDELQRLPLRKKPTVSEHIRIVAIGDDEMVACGGTHPSTAGQLGVVKILFTEPARGKLRLGFVAGMRAYRQLSACYDTLHAAAALFSTSVDNVPRSIRQLSERLSEVNGELIQLKKERTARLIRESLEKAEPAANGWKLLALFQQGTRQELLDAATEAIAHPGVVALCASPSEDAAEFVLGRSRDVSLDLNALFRACAKQAGGRGGGKPDLVQGIAPRQAICALQQALKEAIDKTP